MEKIHVIIKDKEDFDKVVSGSQYLQEMMEQNKYDVVPFLIDDFSIDYLYENQVKAYWIGYGTPEREKLDNDKLLEIIDAIKHNWMSYGKSNKK